MSTERLVESDRRVLVLARLEATGAKTVSCYASGYDATFPPALDGIVSRKEFKFCIEVINQTMEDYFPCLPCYACGFLCCISTCGLSLLFPEPCTRELAENLEIVLRRLNNREELLYRGIIWSMHRCQRTRTSWIEISQLIYE